MRGRLARVRDALRSIDALKEGIERAVNDLETFRDHRRLLLEESVRQISGEVRAKFESLWARVCALEWGIVDFMIRLNGVAGVSPERRARYSRDL
ncbi:MAG: hypothetical protein ACTSU5_09115, partial [Promethearchaeota archaeon]